MKFGAEELFKEEEKEEDELQVLIPTLVIRPETCGSVLHGEFIHQPLPPSNFTKTKSTIFFHTQVDIDDILRRAETHHTQDTSNEADELLSQFKVVSVDNMEDEELERYDPGNEGRHFYSPGA